MNRYVDILLELANKAYSNEDIPVGAIVVKNDEIIGKGYNTRNSSGDVLGHAEIAAINEASKKIGDWRLDDCTLYVTLKPCMMCTGVIIESRIRDVVYLIDRTNVLFNPDEFINISRISSDYRVDEYLKLLQTFFENKRNK